MKRCPYCGYSNYDEATECRKCQASFAPPAATARRSLWCGPERARAIRHKALSVLVIGILMKVYWGGGYGHWHPIDNPTLTSLRNWLEPLLIYGSIVSYLVGILLQWV